MVAGVCQTVLAGSIIVPLIGNAIFEEEDICKMSVSLFLALPPEQF